MNAAADVDIIMIDTVVYLEKLALFGSLLRDEGIEVSPKENLDACQILIYFGFTDREVVKTALRTVYAKSKDEQIKFDRVFDSFFLSEDAIRYIDKKHQEQELEKRKAIEEAREALKKQTPDFDYSKEEQEAYSNLSEEEKKRLSDLQKKLSESSTERSSPLYSEFIHSIFMKSILEEQIKMEDAALGAGPLDPELGLLFKDISIFKDSEIPKAVKYIQTLSSQINGELTKKRNGAGKTSVVDFRKTIRKGLETGGSFYHLKFKKPKKKKKNLLLLCDVSGSMIQFSEFALRFIQALNEAADNSKVILFSEDSVEADSFSLQNMDLFRDYVKKTGVFGRGTNLGKALKKINDTRPSILSSSTILIILSDCKSMDVDSMLLQLDKARSKCGKLYCLNPIPESKWKYSSTIVSASLRCTMLSCSTLNDLGSACRRVSMM